MLYTFAVLDIDADGALDVERRNAQQFARVGDPFAPDRPSRGTEELFVDAASRVTARGGSWTPDQALRLRVEAAALGQLASALVRVVH